MIEVELRVSCSVCDKIKRERETSELFAIEVRRVEELRAYLLTGLLVAEGIYGNQSQRKRSKGLVLSIGRPV